MRLSGHTMVREGFEVSLLLAERPAFYNQFDGARSSAFSAS